MCVLHETNHLAAGIIIFNAHFTIRPTGWKLTEMVLSPPPHFVRRIISYYDSIRKCGITHDEKHVLRQYLAEAL